MVRQLVNTVALAAAIALSDSAAAQQVTAQAKAGVLTCDVSAGIGLIIASQKQIRAHSRQRDRGGAKTTTAT